MIPSELSGTFSIALPSEVRLAFLRDGRLRIREALKVTLTREDDQIVAEAEELNEFGYGDNPTDAITDLQRTIAELYFTLGEEKERLGKGLRAVWAMLQAKIQER